MKRWTGVIIALMLMVVGLAASSHASAQTRTQARLRPRATTSAPTLGLAQTYTEGFGHVRPRTVSYGGDPTSLVVRVHWSSWGGAHAVGHGVADWVWPGWCVACASTSLRATVVAFGLRTCGGHPAYAHVEWYFPSRGMKFSFYLGTENVCDPSASSQVKPPPSAHCAPVAISGGHVGKIEVSGFGIHCPVARGLVGHLGLLSHYHHNARFHVGRWWCGSELSMQLGALPPQNFECESGDYNDVSFDLTPTGDVIQG